MPAFLEKLTQEIYSKHKDHLGDICVVLPNRRAILFIKHYLSKLLEKTSLLPEFYSIEDFVARSSGLVITDTLHDQFMLYAIHRELEGEEARSIEEFFPYALWMLSDFNETDMYLADRDDLYTYLSDAKALSLWNPDGRPLTDFEKHYLTFFRSLKYYYDKLNEHNSHKNMAYQGRAFRLLAENIEARTEKWPWYKVIFAGFNALTPAEEKIIITLKKEGKADIFWDADEYYLNDSLQEAGYFMRRYFRETFREEPRWITTDYQSPKSIKIVGVPGNIGQVKYAGELLQRIVREKGSLDKTALVLSDESLLLPMLNSIPPEAGKFNVTMGLGLKHTPLFTLLDHIIGMFRNAEHFSEIRGSGDRTFYSIDLIRLITHPWIRTLLRYNGLKSDAVNENIRQSNRIFLPLEQFNELIRTEKGNDIRTILETETDPGSLLSAIDNLISSLRGIYISLRKEEEGSFGLELEYLFRFSKLVQRMKDLAASYGTITTIRSLQMIFRQLARQEKIAFRGEPLQGLQIMGMLETRTLDFDNIIMLSVNEGTLPSARMPNSFIPYDIKQEFGLPTYKHNNAVFAYHFYRMIQRAGDVYLLYNTEADALGGGEKSRFITQLQHEARKYNPGISVSEDLLSMPPPAGTRDDPITIVKDEEVMQQLRNEAEKGFHPSSLSIYINCPLQFYLSRLAGLEEAEDLEETIDAKTLGTVVHESLSSLLEKYKGHVMSRSAFMSAKKEIKAEVNRQFSRFYHRDDISYGKNYLVVNVAVEMLSRLFNREAEWLNDEEDLIIHELEKQLLADVEIGNIGRIRFRGTADRIDSKGDQIRILDYKTGSVETSGLRPKGWEAVFSDPKYRQAFQLMMYAWLYRQSTGKEINTGAGIISLRAPGKGPNMIIPPGSGEITSEILAEFETEQFRLISEIFDPGIPFSQTTDDDRCRYCTYREICNRIDHPRLY